MNYFNAILFGLVQGLTEFLPVSSSGHLVILHKYLNLPFENEMVFDVILHLATILAVIWYFRKDIVNILASLLKNMNREGGSDSNLALQIILGTIPAATLGYFFDDIIEEKLRSIFVVVFMLVLVGVVFILVEKFAKKMRGISEIGKLDSIFIGFAQALALIPGTSRSGITIAAGLVRGFKRYDAIRFSFLLSIPIVLGASIKKIPQIFVVDFTSNELIILLISFVSSFFFGFLAIKYFIKFSKKRGLTIFAYYRFALAILLTLLFYFG